MRVWNAVFILIPRGFQTQWIYIYFSHSSLPPLVKTWQNELRHIKTSKPMDSFFFRHVWFIPLALSGMSGASRRRDDEGRMKWREGIRQERIITDEESDRVWGRKVSRQIVKMSPTTIFKNEEVRQVPRERMSCRIASKSHGCDVGGLLLPPFCKVLPPALPALVVYSDSFLCIGR